MIVIITLVSMTIGRNFVMRKKAEDYILREARIGLKVYFEKYFNGVDPNSIKLRIEYSRGMVVEPVIKGYVNDDKNLDFTCSVTKLPENEWKTVQDELGMVITDGGLSDGLSRMQKREYSTLYSDTKGKLAPSELIPEAEVKKAKKNRDLLKYIPEMDSF